MQRFFVEPYLIEKEGSEHLQGYLLLRYHIFHILPDPYRTVMGRSKSRG